MQIAGPLREEDLDRHRLGRPSLRITRQRSSAEANAYVVEVWNPFVGSYQLADTVNHAIRRVEELACLICQMRVRRHPKRNALADPPDVNRTDNLQWAEFRVNAATYRSYDTRRFDRPTWRRETGLTDATHITCEKVGYSDADFRMLVDRSKGGALGMLDNPPERSLRVSI